MEKIQQSDLINKGVVGLPDTPGLTAAEMQRKFEETAREVIIPKFNALVDALLAESGAAEIGAKSLVNEATVTVQKALEELLQLTVHTVVQELTEEQKNTARKNIAALTWKADDLDDGQKRQARENIGAIGTEEISKEGGIVSYKEQQTLSEDQKATAQKNIGAASKDDADEAKSAAETAQSTADEAKSAAATAQSTADGKVSKAGDLITGDLTIAQNVYTFYDVGDAENTHYAIKADSNGGFYIMQFDKNGWVRDIFSVAKDGTVWSSMFLPKTGGDMSGDINFGNRTNGFAWKMDDGSWFNLRPYTLTGEWQLVITDPNGNVTAPFTINSSGLCMFGESKFNANVVAYATNRAGDSVRNISVKNASATADVSTASIYFIRK